MGVDLFEDRTATLLQQSSTNQSTERGRILTFARVSQDGFPVRTGHDCFQMQSAVAEFRVCSDRDLASATQSFQQRAFAFGLGPSRRIVQKFQRGADVAIAAANFYCERSLAC